MQYLKIENPGVAPVECFTLMGCSTTRFAGNANTIGQFGTGLKHAINLFLRQGLEAFYYCGKTCLEFFVEKQNINDGLIEKDFARVNCRITKGANSRVEKLGWFLEVGEIDWQGLSMACREFVSNAFDRTIRETGSWKQTKFEIVEENQVRAKDGTTRIFLPMVEEVSRFYYDLPKRYLFLNSDKLEYGLMTKTVNRHIVHNFGPVIYKQGVYVRELSNITVPSLFDYNFGGELHIDESRNSTDYSVQMAAARRLCNANEYQRTIVVNALKKNTQFWELFISQYDLMDTCTPSSKDNWKKSWGDDVICVTEQEMDLVKNKGHKGCLVPYNWAAFLISCGCQSAQNLLSFHDKAGQLLVEVTDELKEVFEKVWCFLEHNGFTQMLERPELKCFRVLETGMKTLGYYLDNTVYINQELVGGYNESLKTTILEECAHYITKAKDNSREFQNFFMKIITEKCL